MQIHELNTFSGTPGSGDYLAIDDGTETYKVDSTNTGIQTAMTLAEAETGTSTSKRVITPKVLSDAIKSKVDEISAFDESNGTASISTGNTPLKLTSTAVSVTAGKWLLIGEAEFPVNNTGVRHLCWAKGTTVVPVSRQTVPASGSGFTTRLQTTLVVSATASESYNLYGFMFTGSTESISVSWRWQKIRIA